MEMTVCFLLLLLCSAAQLQSHTDNNDGEQTSPPDIHAVLRELNASVAKQRLELSQLQKKNEEQEAKLESQRAELEELKSRTDVTEHQVEALRRDGEVKQVAFSAFLLASEPVTLRSFNSQNILVFRHVVSNIGDAYSPDTGLFTAPVRGAYHFELYIGANGNDNHGASAVLVMNEVEVFHTNEDHYNVYSSSVNVATLLLEVGDVVWVNLRIFDNVNPHSTFSGHLLFYHVRWTQ